MSREEKLIVLAEAHLQLQRLIKDSDNAAWEEDFNEALNATSRVMSAVKAGQ